ncbi:MULTISPECIES: hypothetical protein [Clostridium]|uniref:hypothetical protein n=1 Tax=Clostridium TaxID=1485 RepID=UPI00069F4121|nr:MULTISPECIES: hypothetical protein [Clostridium]KOF56639.1 hypothetical protein AGR56_07875 [Clostridium sp. DMHC 10]MCD2348116.1 hypothetical protein [Clostridium guangxiense]
MAVHKLSLSENREFNHIIYVESNFDTDYVDSVIDDIAGDSICTDDIIADLEQKGFTIKNTCLDEDGEISEFEFEESEELE